MIVDEEAVAESRAAAERLKSRQSPQQRHRRKMLAAAEAVEDAQGVDNTKAVMDTLSKAISIRLPSPPITGGLITCPRAPGPCHCDGRCTGRSGQPVVYGRPRPGGY